MLRLARRARDFGRALALGFARAGLFLRGLAAVGMGDADRFDAGALHPAQRQKPYIARVSGYSRDPRVLVVEDDEDIALAVQRSLRMEGYEVRLAGDGEAALSEANAFMPDMVILDLGLPKLDGIEVARRLRADSDVPILMLTARDALDSRVEGLDSGADDYLVKPFERQELLARLRALLRRRPPRGSRSYVVGDLSLNPDTHEVRRSERDVELTQREFELLEYLMRNERIVVPRQRLLEEVWGYDPFATTNTIEVFVSNLRRKLEAGGEPRLLHTIRGAGYVLRA
jgi:two-component system, OmpR family, response regulator MprA